MKIEVLIFCCDDRHFAVRASHVREVIRAVALSPVPRAPDAVMGMVNMRGKLTPVADTRKLLGFFSVPLRPSDHFIVVDADGILIALHVDRALELLQITTDEDQQHSERERFVELAAKTHFGIVQVIDPAKIFDSVAMNELIQIADSITATQTTQ